MLNPSLDQVKDEANKMDLIVAGTHDAVMMVESEIDELTEEVVLGGVTFAAQAFKPVIDAIIELAEHAAKDPVDFQFTDDAEMIKAIERAGRRRHPGRLRQQGQDGPPARPRRRQGQGHGGTWARPTPARTAST